VRIATVRAVTVRIPLEVPVALGGGVRITEREYLLVALTAENGLTGVGWSYTRGGDLAGVVRRNLRGLVEGRDALAIEPLWETMYHATRYIGRSGMVMRAISAVDVALWDLLGQIQGRPVHALLGGHRTEVPVLMAGMYYTEGRRPDDDAREAAAYAGQGFRMVKLMGGAAPFEVDLARVKAVRSAVGGGVQVALDVNGAWQGMPEAAGYTRALADFGVAFVEEPVLTEDLEGLRALTAASSAPIACGEVDSGRWAFRELIGAGVDILRPDATVVGGISEWVKVHTVALARRRAVLPHDFPYVHVHLAAGLPGVDAVEFVTTAGGISNFHRLVRVALEPRNGMLTAPAAPGLGLTIDWAAVDRYAVREAST
jgi:L-alanine-DL-glutamate epimerase-like enolase superfamily enzyme